MTDSQWMSIVEYARAFNVSDMTVRRRIKTGRLQAVLRDGKYYIPAEGRAPRSETEDYRAPSKPVHREHRPQPRHYETQSAQPQSERRTPAPSPVPRVEYSRPTEVSESRSYTEQAQKLSDLHRMIDVCESAVKSFSNLESKLEENFRSKVQILESKLVAKDREIDQLHQKIQDLQLLVSILEKRRS